MTAKKLISMAGRRIKDSQTSEVKSCGGVNITLLGGMKEKGAPGSVRGVPAEPGPGAAPSGRASACTATKWGAESCGCEK